MIKYIVKLRVLNGVKTIDRNFANPYAARNYMNRLGISSAKYVIVRKI
jgi:hypothetical protein